VSLRGPPCALGVSGIPYGEVRDRQRMRDQPENLSKLGMWVTEYGADFDVALVRY